MHSDSDPRRGSASAGGGSGGNVVRMEDISTALVDVGVRWVKRNPVPVGSYLVGLALCLFFSGLSLSQTQAEAFREDLQRIDYGALEDARYEMQVAYRDYYNSKGYFFRCDDECQWRKKVHQQAEATYNRLKAEETAQISDAKSKLGVFSEVGVQEARDLFWQRFEAGKGVAKRQTKFDAIFYGFRAMTRDENILSYIFSMILNILFNFTMGIIMTVVTFIFSVVGVIRSYQTSILSGLVFFAGAALAAGAFAMTWLIILYLGTATTVYAATKLIAANMRIENGAGRQQPRTHNIRFG